MVISGLKYNKLTIKINELTKRLIFTFSILVFSFSLNAQICDPPCTPDQSCLANYNQNGSICPEELAFAIANSYYEENVTVVPPEGSPYYPFSSMRIDAINNLPEGITWCKSQEMFDVTNPLTCYCVQLKGTPTTHGTYVLSLAITLFVNNEGTQEPVTQYTDTSLEIEVLPEGVELPVADFTWTGNQCYRDTVFFTAANNPAGSSYVWKVNGNVVSEGSPTFSYVFSPFFAVPTDYQVSLIVSTGYYTDDITKTITIYPMPGVSVSVPDYDYNEYVCHGTSFTLTANGAETYLWSTGETGNEITVTLSEFTVITVFGTDIHSCVNRDSIMFFVWSVDTTLTNHNLCEGDVYDFYGTEITEAGTYYHTVTSPYTGCDNIEQLEVTLAPYPEQVVILQDPEDGILQAGTSGSIILETSEVGTKYCVTVGGEPYTGLINGIGSMLSLGGFFPAGSYEVLSRNQYNCYLVQGIANFTSQVSGNLGQIVANVTFGTPASNFPAEHVNVKLYKTEIDITENEVIVLMDQKLLDGNGQTEFLNLTPGDYYLGSFVQYPENYNVAEHVYYQDAVVHEDAISIPIEEGTVFFASLHHVLLTESQGSNTMQGIVGASSNNSKGLNPIEDMVVILKNSDINEIIGVSVTSDNGQYYFDNIPDNANIQAFVTNLSCQNYIAFETQTTSDQTYNVNFIVTETSIYPNDITMLEDMQIQNIEFTVFPNPAKEVLGINCDVEKAILKIFDINGRLVLTDLVFSNSEINISELVTGTYIIILSAENGKTGVQKFVKE